jgi:hypothetical protein
MHVNEWICYECSDEGTCTPNIRNSSTRSHALEGGNRSRNHSKNCKCKRAVLKAFENNADVSAFVFQDAVTQEELIILIQNFGEHS